MTTTTGLRLTSIRQNSRLSQMKVAELTGFTQSVISGHETDRRPLKAKYAHVYADVYNCSIEWLLYGEGEAPDFTNENNFEFTFKYNFNVPFAKGSDQSIRKGDIVTVNTSIGISEGNLAIFTSLPYGSDFKFGFVVTRNINTHEVRSIKNGPKNIRVHIDYEIEDAITGEMLSPSDNTYIVGFVEAVKKVIK